MPRHAMPISNANGSNPYAGTDAATDTDNLRSPAWPEQTRPGQSRALGQPVGSRKLYGHGTCGWRGGAKDAQDFALSVDGNNSNNYSNNNNNKQHFRFMDFQTVAVNYFFFF